MPLAGVCSCGIQSVTYCSLHHYYLTDILVTTCMMNQCHNAGIICTTKSHDLWISGYEGVQMTHTAVWPLTQSQRMSKLKKVTVGEMNWFSFGVHVCVAYIFRDGHLCGDDWATHVIIGATTT